MWAINYIDILSSIVIAIVTAAVGYILGRLVRRGLMYSLSKVGFDEWFKKFAIGKAIIRGGYSASEFFGLVSSWIIYLTSVIIAIALGASYLNINWLADLMYNLVDIYVVGFLKALLIIIVGFILTDAFVGYIYKSSELRGEVRLLVPIAEYLRIMIYLATVLFALEQGGISVHTLNMLIIPIIWGLTIAMVIIIIAEVIQQVIRK